MREYNAILNKVKRSEQGIIAIFVAAVIIPLLFILFTLSFDIASFYTGGEAIQSLADDAALYAYKFLPNKEDARKAASLYIDQNGANWNVTSKEATIQTNSDFISVDLNVQFPLRFAKLFNNEAALPIKKVARVRSTPLDVYIAVDTSSYLAPPLVVGQLPWSGQGSSNTSSDSTWPASTFFTELYPISVDGLPMNNQDERNRAYTLLTQRCFNPVFSEIKLGAISLYDYLSSFDLNSVGLGFYPGATFSLDQARSVLPGGARPNKDLHPGEADFDTYYGNLYSSNIWCAGIAEHERFHNEYKFKELLPTYIKRVEQPPPGERMIYIDSTPIFNEKYREYLQARDVIWSRAVNENESTKSIEVLRSIVSALYVASADKKRGGLITSEAKIGIIISGGLPEEDGMRYPDSRLISKLDTAISEIKDNIAEYGGNFTIYYLFLKHQAVDQVNWDSNISSLAEYFKERSEINQNLPSTSSLNIRVLNASSPSDLVKNVLPLLMLEKRTIMLSE